MDLKQLRYFSAVHQTGTLSAAALECHVAQSALSYQIAKLEEGLGVHLFERRPRGMAPTEEGNRLYQHARRILKAVEDAKADIALQSSIVAGEITVGLPYTALEMIGLQAVERAGERYPDLQLWIAESLSSQALDRLMSGAIDLALLYNPPNTDDLIVTEILTEPLLCIGRPEIIGDSLAPMNFQDVVKLPQLLLRHGDAARAVIEDQRLLEQVIRQSRIELISTNMLKKALVEGFGCAIGPPATLETFLRDPVLKARPITTPQIHRRLCLARLKDRPLTRVGSAVADLLRELVTEAVTGGRWEATLTDAETSF